MEKISPKKSLGQNFLVDKNISRKIADSLDCKPDDVIIEIGCGTGALTEQLLDRNPKYLFSVDIDKRAIDAVKLTLSKTVYNNYELIHSDIRNIQILDLIKKENKTNIRFKVIGNIPYNISGDILFWLFTQRHLIDKAIIMMQKEVVQRLTAKPNSKLYGITTVAMNLTSDCKALFNVSPKCFYPVPKVTSTVLEIIPGKDKFAGVEFDDVMTLVKAAFNQRRKVLKNALFGYFQNSGISIDDISKTAPREISVMFSKRAEQLNVQDYISLYNYFESIKKEIK
ncbi:MAG: 16S rRNA (adenine(1518)-N(6)/adenine(1519)-N(6))-dimethyltransferase RsmA [bacterium]